MGKVLFLLEVLLLVLMYYILVIWHILLKHLNYNIWLRFCFLDLYALKMVVFILIYVYLVTFVLDHVVASQRNVDVAMYASLFNGPKTIV